MLRSSQEAQREVTSLLLHGSFPPTHSFIFNSENLGLANNNNCIVPLDPKLIELIMAAPQVVVIPEGVFYIKALEFAELNNKLSMELANLVSDNEQLRKVIASMQEKITQLTAEHQRAQEQQQKQQEEQRRLAALHVHQWQQLHEQQRANK